LPYGGGFNFYLFNSARQGLEHSWYKYRYHGASSLSTSIGCWVFHPPFLIIAYTNRSMVWPSLVTLRRRRPS
jgi:hypothetical protein